MSRGARGFPYLTLKTKVRAPKGAKYRERFGGGDALRASFCVKMWGEDYGVRACDFLPFPCISCDSPTIS